MAVSLSLNTQLVVSAATSSGSCGSSTQGSTADIYPVELGSPQSSAATNLGSKEFEFTSTAAYLALPVYSTMEGRLVYIKVITGDDILVQLTHATLGAVVYPVAGRGLLLITPAEGEEVTGVAVRGEGKIMWMIAGEV